jgi:formate dehydrogenase maturation protein FdhE
MFGLGLYIYAGEDLPDDAEEIEKEKERENIAKAIRAIKKLNKDKELNLILKELNSNLEELDTDKLKYIYNKLKVS